VSTAVKQNSIYKTLFAQLAASECSFKLGELRKRQRFCKGKSYLRINVTVFLRSQLAYEQGKYTEGT